MRSMNSVLLEGKVVNSPYEDDAHELEPGEVTLNLEITDVRDGKEIRQRVPLVLGMKLGKNQLPAIREGERLRIVGRWWSCNQFQHCVKVEHLEWRSGWAK